MCFLSIVLLVLINVIVSAKKHSTCREPIISSNFDATKILGHWYEYSRHHHDFEAGCDCLTSELVAIDENSFRIANCCQMSGVSTETQKCEIGLNKITFINPETKEASFKYTRTGSTVESHVWVVDTDYDNYLIANGCDHVNDEEEREIFWILSREREINEAEVQKINEVLKTHHFEKSKIIKQRHGADLCKFKRPAKATSMRKGQAFSTLTF